MPTLEDIPPIYKGEYVNLIFTQTPLTDITGWTISFRVKIDHSDSTPLLTVNATLTTPSVGVYTCSITSAQTAALSAGKYAFDVWRTDAGSEAILAIGNMIVKGSVRVP